MNTVWGFPAGPFSRLFVSYSYQNVQVKDLNPLYAQAAAAGNNPFLADSLLLGAERRAADQQDRSELQSTTRSTIRSSRRPAASYSLSFDLAGLGGNSKFYTAEGRRHLLYKSSTAGPRSACARRVSSTSTPLRRAPQELPIFEKLFLGGEYSIRGFDIRSVGPRDPATGLVIGGNKSLLFNAEYLITSPARCAWSCSTTPARCATAARTSAGASRSQQADHASTGLPRPTR